MNKSLIGKKGLIVGVANQESIAYGCMRALKAQGAELAITYLNAKAEAYVRPLAEALEAALILPLNVEKEGELEAVFSAIRQHWGRLDFVIHAIAYCPLEDLHGRVVDCSRAGFERAMRVSCHSFMEMAHLAEPLMVDGGTLVTMSYYGANKVIDNYNIMGPVKAALESICRYMACELAEKRIRVHALSPSLLLTRAASGIAQYEALYAATQQKIPQIDPVTTDDVGQACAFLVSDAAKSLTGQTIYVDGGYHIKA